MCRIQAFSVILLPHSVHRHSNLTDDNGSEFNPSYQTENLPSVFRVLITAPFLTGFSEQMHLGVTSPNAMASKKPSLGASTVGRKTNCGSAF
jgi:hypothetical protein